MRTAEDEEKISRWNDEDKEEGVTQGLRWKKRKNRKKRRRTWKSWNRPEVHSNNSAQLTATVCSTKKCFFLKFS